MLQDPITTPPVTTTATGNTDNPMLKAITDKLLSTSDMISSNNTNLDNTIQSAIANVSKANEASKGVVNSQFDRQIGYQKETNNNAISSFQEATRGFAVNTAAYRGLVTEADKNIKDLEQRRQELLMQGDAQSASKIADLQFKSMEMKTQAMQSTFANLLGIGNFALSTDQNTRANRTQSLNETKTISDLITSNPQAGILPTDTQQQALEKLSKNPNSPDVLYKKAQIDNIRSEIIARAASSGQKISGTESERQAAVLGKFAALMTPGHTLADGTPVIDQNGYITPKAWKTAMQDAPAKNIDRKQFIQQFGYLLSPYDANSKESTATYKAYGLTPQEIKLITG